MQGQPTLAAVLLVLNSHPAVGFQPSSWAWVLMLNKDIQNKHSTSVDLREYMT